MGRSAKRTCLLQMQDGFRVMTHCQDCLCVCCRQVCGADTPFPLVFEPLYLPGVERLVDAIKSTVRY